MSNLPIWNSKTVVDSYRTQYELLGPESAIIQLFKDQWRNWRMLDIGIGSGRTTKHFAPLVKEYIGFDYAEFMVKAAQEAFPNIGEHVTIKVGDARSMPEFETDYFDFVLFSFNGLDDISYEDRIQALKEMKRVGKKGGYVFFSSHNLEYIPNLYKIRHNNNLNYFAYQCYRYLMLLYHNGLPQKFRKMEYAVIKDGAEHFSIKNYYVKPAAMVPANRIGI
ncbi:MAG: class I SAM-dependent methyltransferase [Lewinellaceae bacterium]|nr:class I SAM-dependent methyltransferase [Lewinellaceae bacterium]